MKRNLLLILFTLLVSLVSSASEPSVWSINSRSDVLKGDSKGVSIDENGTITISPRLAEVYKTGQPYIWSSICDAAGNIYLGTGSDGKIFKVDQGGRGSLFADLNELNVSAMAVGRDGTLFVGTSPDGKVYRVDTAGTSSVYFDPKEKYIWSFAIMADGSLAVGTGENGRIYRIRSANAAPETSLLFDTSETHIISMAADGQGNLYAGTDSNGLVMKFGPGGRPFGLLDSTLREIHEIVLGQDGSIYVLALGESLSASKTEATATPAAAESKAVSIAKPNLSAPEPPVKSRYDLTGARSAVYRIAPGGSDVLWVSQTIAGFSIFPDRTGRGVLLGTSDKGRIFNIDNTGSETLVLQTEANLLSTIGALGQDLYATSSNQGNLFRFGGGSAAEGSYESAVLDAKTPSKWGRIWWRSSGSVSIQTRSGNTERPDETWSEWSPPMSDQLGAQISSPGAQFLQWRAVLKNGNPAPSLNEVNASFLANNIAPEVLEINQLPTNVGLAPTPPVQIDPNIELSGLDPAIFGVPIVAVPPRKIYQRGAMSLQWTAEDRNGDRMVYDVQYKEVGESAFKTLRQNISENFFTLDGQSLADGRYVFKIIAKDAPSNPLPAALTGDKVSEPIDLDNTAPVVSGIVPQISGDLARVSFTAADAASYLTRAEYSVNGGDWRPVYSDDGISDGSRESYTFNIPATVPGEHTITLRVFDVNGNAGNARVVFRR
ncbi:MAG: hypothetical protein WBD22_06055 [Pyrinomonadaceae bacterium]